MLRDERMGAQNAGQRVALVTGAAGTIGTATAIALAKAGWQVVAADIGQVPETVTASGAVAVHLDVTAPRSWDAAVEQVSREFGRLDAIVNAAGIPSSSADSVGTLTEDEWDRVLDVNLKGAWLAVRAGLPLLTESPVGRVVLFSSAAALRGMPGQLAYTAAKGALLAVTRQLAVELAPHGITVNCVAPGIMQMPMAGGIPNGEVRQRLIDMQPISREVTADEVAEVVMYLASDAAGMVTGQILSIDGGRATT